MSDNAELREAFAAQAHEAWSGWMRYIFSKTHGYFSKTHGYNEAQVIRREQVERWTRQMNTPYADLPEEEKESDRKEADEYLALLQSGRWA